MVVIGTQASLQPLRRQTGIISTSNSNPVSWLSRVAVISRRPRRRYPDWLSGMRCPTAQENSAVPSVLDRRRTGGMRAKSRRPMISSGRGPPAPGAVSSATNRGISSGSCWPSASSVTTASQPSSRAHRKPVRSAAPLPRFGCWRMTRAPARSAFAAVPSVEPSSTTSTGRCRRAASTTAPIRGPSSYPGMSARIRVMTGLSAPPMPARRAPARISRSRTAGS